MWRTEESVYIEEYRRGLWEVCNEIFASFLPSSKPCVINSPCTVGGIKKKKKTNPRRAITVQVKGSTVYHFLSKDQDVCYFEQGKQRSV